MGKFIVYALLCPKCGCPRYVGQSSRGAGRLQDHLRGIEAPDDCRHKKSWVQSLLDLGLKPGWLVLLELPLAEGLDAAEVFWIAEMRRRGFPLTNLTDGGCGRRGHKDSQETKDRRNASLRGKPVPQERRDRISATLTGRPRPWVGSDAQRAWVEELHAQPFTEEERSKMSASASARWSSQEERDAQAKRLTGKVQSQETKDKRAAANRGQKRSAAQVQNIIDGTAHRRKPIQDQHGRVYPGVNAAARQLGLSAGNITMVLKGKYKQTGGLTFSYVGPVL